VKTSWRIFSLIAVILLVTACGYHNPNVYTGPSKTIYLAEWKNRTSELRLNSEIYRSLTRWFQKTGSISTVRQKEGADLILAGEIVFLELPSLSYDADNTTAEVKVRLMVRYILKEIASNKIVLETPSELWTEEYLVSNTSTSTLDNEREALETIIEDLSKKIYQRTITLLPKL
jgi:outer membrane lipopolysaccharide assembly protein LptE/RlpB